MQFQKRDDGNTRGSLEAAPPVPKGTGIEFYAEMDAYLVISNCPVGDQSAPTVEAKPFPLYISVSETGIKPLKSRDFHDWERAFYKMVERGEKKVSPRHPETFVKS